MRIQSSTSAFTLAVAATATLFTTLSAGHPTTEAIQPLSSASSPTAALLLAPAARPHPNISLALFAELEELSRIVDISYCVGTSGISKPFSCASRCDEFPTFELVGTFNTGPLMSDSCGYVVLDHGDGSGGVARRRGAVGQRGGRIIVAFRGTYSIANTIVDLSTVPQEYVPYPGDPKDPGDGADGERPTLPLAEDERNWKKSSGEGQGEGQGEGKGKVKCGNCTVHSGFWTSWQNTRPFVLPSIEAARKEHPDYQLHLVGHSLGGAVAALAALEFDALGFEPVVTTFGEPKVGNAGLRTFLDQVFGLPTGNATSVEKEKTKIVVEGGRYRRITHVDDPVPLLPLHEWGYRPHAGEVFISKSALQPSLSDLRHCYGDEDVDCIAGAEVDQSWFNGFFEKTVSGEEASQVEMNEMQEEELRKLQRRWGIPIPSRYKMWQLFFAHRDYFWRLGLCVAGGDPSDWGRDKYRFGDGEQNGEEIRMELR